MTDFYRWVKSSLRLLFKNAYEDRQRKKEIAYSIRVFGFDNYRKNQSRLKHEKKFRQFDQQLETLKGAGVTMQDSYITKEDAFVFSRKD